MKLRKIIAWMIVISGVPLLPSLIVPYPSYLSVPFYILMGIFIAGIILFGTIETLEKKQYLILSLFILMGALFLFGLISGTYQ